MAFHIDFSEDAKRQLGQLTARDRAIIVNAIEDQLLHDPTMQRQAYGYRDQEFFTLKIYAAHEAKYALVG